MKTRSLVCKAVLLLGFGPLYFIKLHAQQATPAEKNVMHLKIIQEKDGKKMVIDTIIENNPGFDADAYLRGKGINTSLPPMPPLPPLPPMPPMPGEPAMPPLPPMPPEFPEVIFETITNTADSTFQGEMFIVTSDGKEFTSTNSAKGIKRIVIYADKKINLSSLNEEEASELNIPDKKNELHVEELNVYPNPNNGFFRLQFELSNKGTTTITIAEKNGNAVYTEKLKEFTGKYEKDIDLSDRPKGMYYLTVKQGNHSLVRKLVVE